MNAIIAYLFVSCVVVPVVLWFARKSDDQAPRWDRVQQEHDQLLGELRRVA